MRSSSTDLGLDRPQQHVEQVHSQIHERATTTQRWIEKPDPTAARPVRVAEHRRRRADGADLGQRRTQRFRRLEQPIGIVHQQYPVGGLRQLDRGPRIVGRHRQRLLHQHRLARAQRRLGLRDMEDVRGGDHHRVDRAQLEQILEPLAMPRAAVPLGHLRGQRRIRILDAGDAQPRHARQVVQHGVPDQTQAGESHANRLSCRPRRAL